MARMETGLQEGLAEARRRMRFQRLATAAGIFLRFAAGFLTVVLGTALIFPGLCAWGGGLLAILGGCFFLTGLAAWFWPCRKEHLAGEMDARFQLPDHVLTATELNAAPDGSWLELQYRDTISRLRNADWKNAWPVRWPRFSLACGLAAAGLAALLMARTLTYVPPALAAMPSDDLKEEAAALEELFQDWEKAAELTDDPKLKEVLAGLRPLREQLPKMSEREMLTALSKLENTLESLREAAAKDSMEASAAEMASAFEGIEDMGALAAALRRKDFEKAAELARREQQKLSQPQASAPRGSDSAGAQQQMKQAAQKLDQSGQKAAAAAMGEMRQGAENKNPGEMAKGLGKLSESFGREAQRQAASQRLGLQLAQIGQCKSCLGQGEKQGMGRGLSLLPRLSDQPGGDGAGSERDPNRVKDPTQLDANRVAQNLTGEAGEGESQTESLSSDTSGQEAPRADRAAQFAQYEKLSRQAIADESLPLAYREAIRKYFEAIRPANEK